MPYIAICRDDAGKDTESLRRSAKQQHFDYIESILEHLLVAGPLPREQDGAHRASLFVYAVDSEPAARELLEADPYYKAGIYADVELQAFLPAAGSWIGGKIW